MDGNLCITKFGKQYNAPNGQQILVTRDSHPVPCNRVRYQGEYPSATTSASPPSESAEDLRERSGSRQIVDIVIDGNRIEHSSVGIQIGPSREGSVIVNEINSMSGNRLVCGFSSIATHQPNGEVTITFQSGSSHSRHRCIPSASGSWPAALNSLFH